MFNNVALPDSRSSVKPVRTHRAQIKQKSYLKVSILSQKYGIYGSNKEGMNPQDLCRLHNEPKISQTVRFGCASGPFSRSYESGLYNYNVC